MDNLETYLYILFAVIYIISRIIKARGKQGQPKPGQPQRPAPFSGSARQSQRPPKPKKAFTFEDVLKEFEKNLAGEDEGTSYEKPLPVKEIKHETPAPKPVESIAAKPDPYKSYQGTLYEEKPKSESKTGKGMFERNEKYSIKENIVNEYVEMLRDPDGFKNAIVLSEIINRKHF
ncbi:MAG: hypothetical protein MI975_11005 [Cytophagales bacterium]|nr:hypothetical protein [Cytophagales bacterium]